MTVQQRYWHLNNQALEQVEKMFEHCTIGFSRLPKREELAEGDFFEGGCYSRCIIRHTVISEIEAHGEIEAHPQG